MDLWILYAVGAAVFAALTTILAKIGIKNTDSHLATAVRTLVVLVFAWVMVFVVGAQNGMGYIQGKTWVFLILSGLATGGSWLCYFRALKLGNVNKVVPIDKSSTILTMVLAFIFLREPVSLATVGGMALMGIGAWLMLELKRKSVGKDGSEGELEVDERNGENIDSDNDKDDCNDGIINADRKKKGWLFYAVMAAAFASLVAIFGRIGVVDIDPTLWTAIRTMVVVPLSWLMVLSVGSHKNIKRVDRKSWVFLVLSGVATGGSWLFFYHALQIGNASHVVPIDKLSIVLTMGFARLFLGERFSIRSIAGLVVLTAGTLVSIFI